MRCESPETMIKRRRNGFGRKAMTQDEFIAKATLVHKGYYDYSKTVYIPAPVIDGKQTREKVCITCPNHGDFFQYPQNHLFGKGCLACSGLRRLTLQEFIAKAKDTHGEKYDYSKVIYKNAMVKVEIICPTHGSFLQRPSQHLAGTGCHFCSVDRQRLTLKDFINKAKAVHGNKYDYSKVVYYNGLKVVRIICKVHGEFKQKPFIHLSGHGCKECNADRQRIPFEEVILRARNKHGDKYDYSKAKPIKGVHDKISIICPKHGEFKQGACYHFSGQGCPSCSRSLGEEAINNWLTINGIKFSPQHTFPDLKLKRVLPVDFFLPGHNMVIEFDGMQHFEPVCFNGGSKEMALARFANIQKIDRIKTEYCTRNGLSLLRISYKNLKIVSEILEAALNRGPKNVQ